MTDPHEKEEREMTLEKKTAHDPEWQDEDIAETQEEDHLEWFRFQELLKDLNKER